MACELLVSVRSNSRLPCGDPAAARWEGSVRIPGRELQLVIDLAQSSDGKRIGSAIVPSFGIKRVPLAGIAVKNSDVSFTIKGVLGEPKLAGRLTENGDFEQAGNKASFTLQEDRTATRGLAAPQHAGAQRNGRRVERRDGLSAIPSMSRSGSPIRAVKPRRNSTLSASATVP